MLFVYFTPNVLKYVPFIVHKSAKHWFMQIFGDQPRVLGKLEEIAFKHLSVSYVQRAAPS